MDQIESVRAELQARKGDISRCARGIKADPTTLYRFVKGITTPRAERLFMLKAWLDSNPRDTN